jgi:hypothetical protein
MSDPQAQHKAPQAPTAEAQPRPDPLAGDWSEGLPGPAREHGLPLPLRLGETRIPAPVPEEPLRPMETPWSEQIQPPPDPSWSMAPPANSDAPWAVAPPPTTDWPTTSATTPAGDEMWSAATTAEPVAAAEWSPAPPPKKPLRSAPSSAAPDAGSWSAPPPGTGDDLSPEPAAPRWSDSKRPEFAPLPPGASLAGEEEETPRPVDESEAASLLRPVVDGAAAASLLRPVVDDAAAATLLRPVVEDASAFLRPVESAANDAPPRPRIVRPEDDPDLLVPVADKPAVAASGDSTPPGEMVAGEHRVAIHARGGRTRRGTVTDLDLTRPQFALQPQGGGPAETVAHSELKAIFFMLAPGETASTPAGRKVRVTFSDGRSIEGHREGVDLRQGFFLVPLDAQKTNTKRIYVAKGAVASVTTVG